MNLNPFSAIASAVGGFFGKREERKSMERQIDGKIAMQKQGGETQVIFNEQEIDAIAKRNEGGTWKDEYITLVMTSPLLTIWKLHQQVLENLEFLLLLLRSVMLFLMQLENE